MDTCDKKDLLGLDKEAILGFLHSIDEKVSFRANQLMHWIYEKRVTQFSEMSNIPGRIRDKLEEKAYIGIPSDVEVFADDDTDTNVTRFLFRSDEDDEGKQAVFEAVLIPETRGEDTIRRTVCISSQSGCNMNCSFCATGKLGLHRNLTLSEIIGQVYYIQDYLGITENITNVVFMGMGEPLLNFENVRDAVKILKSSPGFGISGRKITISTCGIVPGIKRMIEEKVKTRLAISLNAPNDKIRAQIMPITKKYNIEQVLETAQEFYDVSGRWVTLEYVLLSGINDSIEEASELASKIKKYDVKVNLIPYNEVSDMPFVRSSMATMQIFQAHLLSQGITATIRNSQGSSINAACGQLAGSEGYLP